MISYRTTSLTSNTYTVHRHTHTFSRHTVSRTTPIPYRYKMVVFPAPSRPKIRILISLFPHNLLNKLEKKLPAITSDTEQQVIDSHGSVASSPFWNKHAHPFLTSAQKPGDVSRYNHEQNGWQPDHVIGIHGRVQGGQEILGLRNTSTFIIAFLTFQSRLHVLARRAPRPSVPTLSHGRAL